MENCVLVDRLVRDWNTLMGMKGCCPNCSEGSVVESWVLMDRLGRDWNTLVGMKVRAVCPGDSFEDACLK